MGPVNDPIGKFIALFSKKRLANKETEGVIIPH